MSFFRLTAEQCGHLALALRLWRRYLESKAVAVPEWCEPLATELADEVIGGHSGSALDALQQMLDGAGMDKLLLTYEEAAEALAVSRSTVKRLVSGGDLPTVTVGEGSPRIHANDLADYAARLRGAPETKATTA